MSSLLTRGGTVAAHVESLHPSLGLRARLGFGTASWGTTAFAVDAAMLLLAVAGAELGARASGSASLDLLWTVLFLAGCALLYERRGLYASRLRLDALEDAKDLVVQTTIAAMVVLTAQLVLQVGASGDVSPDVTGVIRLWGFAAVYVAAGRVAFYWSQTQARRKGEVVSPTLIVGAGQVGRLVARRLLANRDLGLLPIGFLDEHVEAAAQREGEVPIPVVGTTDEIERLTRQYDVTQVVVNCSAGLVDEHLVPLVNRCEQLGIAVAFVPGAHEKITKRLRVEHVGGLPLITAYATDPKGWQYAAKYGIDRMLAAVALMFAAPILLAAAAAVYLSLGRPIFFRQVRIGRDGNPFEIFKFRSMRLADPATRTFTLPDGSAPGGVEGEDRRTRVGTFLRKSSIDELPQLLNVLFGKMSLVGPRPERPEFVGQFEESVYRYGDRHRVKAGITGWAQVNGLRGKTSIADRAEWDNWYVENFSLWLDLKIMLLTIAAVFKVFKTVE